MKRFFNVLYLVLGFVLIIKLDMEKLKIRNKQLKEALEIEVKEVKRLRNELQLIVDKIGKITSMSVNGSLEAAIFQEEVLRLFYGEISGTLDVGICYVCGVIIDERLSNCTDCNINH